MKRLRRSYNKFQQEEEKDKKKSRRYSGPLQGEEEMEQGATEETLEQGSGSRTMFLSPEKPYAVPETPVLEASLSKRHNKELLKAAVTGAAMVATVVGSNFLKKSSESKEPMVSPSLKGKTLVKGTHNEGGETQENQVGKGKVPGSGSKNFEILLKKLEEAKNQRTKVQKQNRNTFISIGILTGTALLLFALPTVLSVFFPPAAFIPLIAAGAYTCQMLVSKMMTHRVQKKIIEEEKQTYDLFDNLEKEMGLKKEPKHCNPGLNPHQMYSKCVSYAHAFKQKCKSVSSFFSKAKESHKAQESQQPLVEEQSKKSHPHISAYFKAFKQKCKSVYYFFSPLQEKSDELKKAEENFFNEIDRLLKKDNLPEEFRELLCKLQMNKEEIGKPTSKVEKWFLRGAQIFGFSLIAVAVIFALSHPLNLVSFVNLHAGWITYSLSNLREHYCVSKDGLPVREMHDAITKYLVEEGLSRQVEQRQEEAESEVSLPPKTRAENVSVPSAEQESSKIPEKQESKVPAEIRSEVSEVIQGEVPAEKTATSWQERYPSQKTQVSHRPHRRPSAQHYRLSSAEEDSEINPAMYVSDVAGGFASSI